MGNYNTVIINLVGSKQSGKTTVAAGVYYELSKRGYKSKLILIDNDQTPIKNFSNLFEQLSILNTNVQFIVLDTSLVTGSDLSAFGSENFSKLTYEGFCAFTNATFLIRPEGNIKEISEELEIKKIFKKYNILYEIVSQSDAVNHIISEIVKYFPIVQQSQFSHIAESKKEDYDDEEDEGIIITNYDKNYEEVDPTKYFYGE